MGRHSGNWRYSRIPFGRYRGNLQQRRPALRQRTPAQAQRAASRNYRRGDGRPRPERSGLVFAKRAAFRRPHAGGHEGEMSAPGKARRRLAYVDPANHTPRFSWKKTDGSTREVFCENVPLSEIARRHETPTYVYSRSAIADA